MAAIEDRRLARRRLLVCLAGVLVLLGTVIRPIKSMGASDLAWWELSPDKAYDACRPSDRPFWCADWFAALDTGKSPFGDRSFPEWRALNFVTNLTSCETLLPPLWCKDWRRFLPQLVGRPSYVAAVTAARERQIDVVAGIVRQEMDADLRSRPLLEALARVGAGQVTPEDVSLLEERAAGRDGEPSAKEALAWLYTQGQGVHRDLVMAYRLYGQLVLEGRRDLQPNLDQIWPLLTAVDRGKLTREFTAGTATSQSQTPASSDRQPGQGPTNLAAGDDAQYRPLKDVLARIASGQVLPADVPLLKQQSDLPGGNQLATETLASLYVQGRGVKRNLPEAYRLYNRLVRQGRLDLQPNLDRLLPFLTAAEREDVAREFAGMKPPG